MVDVAVKSEAAWVCNTEGRALSDIVICVPTGNQSNDVEELAQALGNDVKSGVAVLLEQTEDGAPCVLTLRCTPESHAAIVDLLVLSEARTMEVYDHTGQYCGTARGAKDATESDDRRPVFRKQLLLDCPSPACEIKLLSLAGRTSVLVSRVVVGVRTLQPCTEQGGGGGCSSIDMQQVQSLVQEMGTDLSPGARSLMDMVQFQQKNQSGSLAGFLPLLMGGGAFSALTRDVDASLPTFGAHSRPANTPFSASCKCEDAAEDQDAAMSESYTSSSSSSSPDQPMSDLSSTDTVSSDNGGPVSHTHLTEMMSRLLKGPDQTLACRPELLPVLQSVCGQVTQLRLDNAAQKTSRNGSWELDVAMEQRLEQMERRLKEHMDRRLDALQEKLEEVLQVALKGGAERSVRTVPAHDNTTTTTTTAAAAAED